MQPFALHSEGLSKRYGNNTALDAISISVVQGEHVALVGANGAGKTTFIKCLLDFCAVDSGSIQLFDMPHTETRSRKALCYLPERFMPPHYLSGWNFLRYVLELRGLPFDRPAALEMLSDLDLDAAALTKPVRDFSKGMTQKLGLAVCFLSRPRLLLLDEPMSGLDPKARALVKRQLLKMKREGVTLLFSSHMLSDVSELCDRMFILHKGRLSFTGTPAECLDHFGGATLEESYIRCIDGKPH